MASITIRIPDELKAKLEILAETQRRSVNKQLETLIAEATQGIRVPVQPAQLEQLAQSPDVPFTF